jgi:hypothetical protein
MMKVNLLGERPAYEGDGLWGRIREYYLSLMGTSRRQSPEPSVRERLHSMHRDLSRGYRAGVEPGEWSDVLLDLRGVERARQLMAVAGSLAELGTLNGIDQYALAAFGKAYAVRNHPEILWLEAVSGLRDLRYSLAKRSWGRVLNDSLQPVPETPLG